ncbi:peptidoglycan-binding protein [Streptacidiphilus sp. EB129]|uniref:C40 family peptidase n=1 Tax=Streptacidiphilus sp. EB129 TaxID=3156262 RepID=UPI003515597D
MPVKGTLARRTTRLLAPALAAAFLGLAAGPASAATVPDRINLSSPSCPSVVQQGEDDGCVTELQTLLNQHGTSLTVDGAFGSGTLAAVKSFQSANGLTADGLVGSATRGALYYVNPATPINLGSPRCAVDIQQGENDGCVEEVQNLLNSHGAGLTIDHSFGPATANAVSTYQTSVGLPATGVADPTTKAKLYGQPAPQTPPDLGSARYAAIVSEARAALTQNIPYVWGGGHDSDTGPSIGTCGGYTGTILPCPADHTVGLDCSGFTRWLYWQAGAGDIGQATGDQISNPRFTTVSLANAIPGDLAFFGSGGPSDPDHVGVYTGTVDGVPMMIDQPFTGAYTHYQPVSDGANLIGYYHLT